MMFDELDDAAGTPTGHHRPAEARARAARMRTRRRALTMAVVAVVALSAAGVVGNLPDDRPGADITTYGSTEADGRDRLPDATGPPTTDGPVPTTAAPAPPGTTPDAPPPTAAPEGPAVTTPPPTTSAPTVPTPPDPIDPETDPFEGVSVAHLDPVQGSTVTGTAGLRLLSGGRWEVTVSVDGAAPGVDHVVYGQALTAGGELAEVREICSGRSDAGGHVSCMGTVEADDGPVVTVTVMGYDARSLGYLAVASGEVGGGD